MTINQYLLKLLADDSEPVEFGLSKDGKPLPIRAAPTSWEILGSTTSDEIAASVTFEETTRGYVYNSLDLYIGGNLVDSWPYPDDQHLDPNVPRDVSFVFQLGSP